MAIRAQPMKTVFSRVPRIIRELEVETGKRVRLEVEGEMTEVDKTVVERIGEPLTHLIRNAVDHGLETPADRKAAGKDGEGVVTLSAAHQSGRIVITVADDGRGIDRARVKAKAIERGIIAPDAQLSEEEIDNLIFAPVSRPPPSSRTFRAAASAWTWCARTSRRWAAASASSPNWARGRASRSACR
ncbi:hypothetical protein GCM10020258_13480 [Sphingomonas yabuuchiae]